MKVAIFGDSISEGIGSRKENYAAKLQEKLQVICHERVVIKNYAHTGTTIKYIGDNIQSRIEEGIDVIVVFYGNVDAMLRPDPNHVPNYYSYLPSRYKKNGMLNPRPYYSKHLHKKLIQHCDSWIRWHLNCWLLKHQGTTTWVSIDEFEKEYKRIVEIANCYNVNVICCSTVYVDERFFPGTNNMYSIFNSRIRMIADSFQNASYIDLYSMFSKDHKWKLMYEDHFHPNSDGYENIAQKLCDRIIGRNDNDEL